MRATAQFRKIGKRYRERRALYGKPCNQLSYLVWRIIDRRRWGALGRYISLSRRIPGWTRDAEAVALAQASYELPAGAVIVEIGSFLGGSAVLLAGARKLQGSGRVYCVDPFDASGDVFSVAIYRAIGRSRQISLREWFDSNIHHAGLSDWVQTCQGGAGEVAARWVESIDMLFLDGDQSRAGARTAYASWSPFLKCGGILAVHNSTGGVAHEGHDGQMRLVAETVRPPHYAEIRCIGTTTFARKMR